MKLFYFLGFMTISTVVNASAIANPLQQAPAACGFSCGKQRDLGPAGCICPNQDNCHRWTCSNGFQAICGKTKGGCGQA